MADAKELSERLEKLADDTISPDDDTILEAIRYVRAAEIQQARDWWVWPVQDGSWAAGNYRTILGTGVDPASAVLDAEATQTGGTKP